MKRPSAIWVGECIGTRIKGLFAGSELERIAEWFRKCSVHRQIMPRPFFRIFNRLPVENRLTSN
jgi:hypothetical protein